MRRAAETIAWAAMVYERRAYWMGEGGGIDMNVRELIEKLQNAVDHGQNPDAEVIAWDPDMETWAPITVLVLDITYVRIYTDQP